MDEGLLNDLLECSVCLERLDTSSRVLPCQHTFCLKCLKVIVESHKELRCPECRVLVEAKVEELPPNVLLMRILEGMRNTPRKATTSQRKVGHHQFQNHPQPNQPQNVNSQVRADMKQMPPQARGLYDYISQEPGDLSFKKGENILLQKRIDPFWYRGECGGRSGIFPLNYVQIIVPLPAPTALCKALYDFRMSGPDEEGCLAFDKGAIITVHRRVDENWAEGRLEERVGIFPIAFVELNHAARQIISSSCLSRPVPPVPEVKAVDQRHLHHTQPHRFPSPLQTYQNIPPQSHTHFSHTHTHLLLPTHTDTLLTHNNLIHTQNTDYIQLKGQQTLSIQGVSNATQEANRLRNKYDLSIKNDIYQNVRQDFPTAVASFNNTDSSSQVSSTPNSSSESAEPSTPSSPDNDRNVSLNPSNQNLTCLNPSTQNLPSLKPSTQNLPSQNPSTQNLPSQNPVNHNLTSQEASDLNSSMGVMSLKESSTATNTSLNVSLPAEGGNDEAQPVPSPSVDAPSTSASMCTSVRSGPESLLSLGVSLQASLSPSARRDRDKRHSLTHTHHHNGQQTNRHSAEILATSLLDSRIEPRDLRERPDRGERPDRSERSDRRRRRSVSSERSLPATYVALYPYKPQKSDELELRKGGVYIVSERCRDGWFKGSSERTQRTGVFPGNYVAPTNTKPKLDKPLSAVPAPAPATPPRGPPPQPISYPWTPQTQQPTPKTDKPKEPKPRIDKHSLTSGVNLMRRLAAMKRCRSPPAQGTPPYYLDNPVFEMGPGTSLTHTHGQGQGQPDSLTHGPQHVRSGSCPSQLLRAPVSEIAPSSHRIRTKHRPSVFTAHEHPPNRSTSDAVWQTQHRKSQSLDVTATTRRDGKQHSQTVKERFRCIAPYPPNSEYELELKKDDIVLVHRKRGDGWYKGTLQRTGRTGLFPASFVQSCPAE